MSPDRCSASCRRFPQDLTRHRSVPLRRPLALRVRFGSSGSSLPEVTNANPRGLGRAVADKLRTSEDRAAAERGTALGAAVTGPDAAAGRAGGHRRSPGRPRLRARLVAPSFTVPRRHPRAHDVLLEHRRCLPDGRAALGRHRHRDPGGNGPRSGRPGSGRWRYSTSTPGSSASTPNASDRRAAAPAGRRRGSAAARGGSTRT